MTKPSSTQSPKHPSAEARRLWVKLQTDFTIDDEAGKLIVQCALEAYDRLQEARASLAKEGSVTRDRWGQAKRHPATLID